MLVLCGGGSGKKLKHKEKYVFYDDGTRWDNHPDILKALGPGFRYNQNSSYICEDGHSLEEAIRHYNSDGKYEVKFVRTSYYGSGESKVYATDMDAVYIRDKKFIKEREELKKFMDNLKKEDQVVVKKEHQNIRNKFENGNVLTIKAVFSDWVKVKSADGDVCALNKDILMCADEMEVTRPVGQIAEHRIEAIFLKKKCEAIQIGCQKVTVEEVKDIFQRCLAVGVDFDGMLVKKETK